MEILLELEKLLDTEIQTFEEIEKKLVEKKETLIKGDADRLKVVDAQLIEYNKKLEQILNSKKIINMNFGDENKTLSEIIKNIQDKTIAGRLENKKIIINAKTKNIEMLNSIIMELIKHALRLIEGSVLSVAEVLNPQARVQVGYDRKGQKGQMGQMGTPQGISSIVEEA